MRLEVEQVIGTTPTAVTLNSYEEKKTGSPTRCLYSLMPKYWAVIIVQYPIVQDD